MLVQKQMVKKLVGSGRKIRQRNDVIRAGWSGVCACVCVCVTSKSGPCRCSRYGCFSDGTRQSRFSSAPPQSHFPGPLRDWPLIIHVVVESFRNWRFSLLVAAYCIHTRFLSHLTRTIYLDKHLNNADNINIRSLHRAASLLFFLHDGCVRQST